MFSFKSGAGNRTPDPLVNKCFKLRAETNYANAPAIGIEQVVLDLSYHFSNIHFKKLFFTSPCWGFEPATPGLQVQHSTN